MPEFAVTEIRALTFDIFGTTVDWYTGVADQVAEIARQRGVALAGAEFAEAWRGRYLPALARVNAGERDWAHLDVLHRESLEELLAERGVANAFDEAARQQLVRAWHRLPAWPDSVAGLARLRGRFTTAAFSNGGFALLTNLVKAAALPFDCIVSAQLFRAYKTARHTYLGAAKLLDLRPAQVLMVACHDWDLRGARAAGLRTAFVERPLEKGPSRSADRAEDVACDLAVGSFTELADALGC